MSSRKASIIALIATLCLLLSTIASIHGSPTPHASTTQHSDNWAVILSTSKYWFNYRHNSDALTLYHLIKKQGIPDSNIILMLPEDVACTTKNVVPATVFNTPGAFPRGTPGIYNQQDYTSADNFSHAGQDSSGVSHNTRGDNLYDESSIEIDYKGDDVTVENFLRVLTGRHDPSTPRNKRLMSNENSNVFIYSSSHSGSGFTKFRDAEILTAHDLEYAVHALYISKRFKNLYLAVETCQAATMVEGIATPNVITSASSLRGENSYSHGTDPVLGLSIVDKYTYYLHQFYDSTGEFRTGGSWPIGEKVDKKGNIVGEDGEVVMSKREALRNGGKSYPPNMLDMFNTFTYNKLHSTHHYRTELFEFSSVFTRHGARNQAQEHDRNQENGKHGGENGNEQPEASALSLIQILRFLDLPESNASFITMFNELGVPYAYQSPVLTFLEWLGLPDNMSGATDDNIVLALGGTIELDLRQKERDIRNVPVLDFFGASLRTTNRASGQQPEAGKGKGGFDFEVIEKLNQLNRDQNDHNDQNDHSPLFSLDSIKLERQRQRQQQQDKLDAKRRKEEVYERYHFETSRPGSKSFNLVQFLTQILTQFLPYIYLISVVIVSIQVTYFVFFGGDYEQKVKTRL